MKLRILFSAIVGNALEWYDYLLYAYFADIFAKLFFPTSDEYLSIMISFAAFAIGFVARPLGGIVFGYIGDRFGRKVSLTISIILIAVPTTIMGLLPTYYQIGIFAPILLILMRILQGISLGGEFSASSTFLVESAPKNQQGFYGSFSTASIGLGMILASAVALLIHHYFTASEIQEFAWRIPFVSSIFIGVLGIYLRSHLEESEAFKKAQTQHKLIQKPLRTIFKNYPANFFISCGIFMCITIPIYSFVVYSKSIMQILGYSFGDVEKYHIIILCSFMLITPFFGYLCDKYNPKLFLMISALLIALFTPLFLMALINGSQIQLWLAFISAGALLATFQGAMPKMIVNNFPIQVRSSGVGMSYSFTAAIFGGTAPMILTFLIKNYGLFSMFYYILFGSFASIIALIFWGRLKQ